MQLEKFPIAQQRAAVDRAHQRALATGRQSERQYEGDRLRAAADTLAWMDSCEDEFREFRKWKAQRGQSA